MKKTVLLVIAIAFFASYAISQSCGSCRVSSFNYLKYNELDNAKTQSDFCITCDKNKINPYVWYYRGMIYQNIQNSKDFKNLDPNAADVAYDSYKKALLFNFTDPALQALNLDNEVDVIKFFTALNDLKTKYVDQEILMDILMNQFPTISIIFVNQGVEIFQKKSTDPILSVSYSDNNGATVQETGFGEWEKSVKFQKDTLASINAKLNIGDIITVTISVNGAVVKSIVNKGENAIANVSVPVKKDSKVVYKVTGNCKGKNYKDAYELFSKSLFVSTMSMKLDTPVVFYTAIAAERSGLYKEAKESFELLTKLNYGKTEKDKVSNYYNLGVLQKHLGDTLKAIETYKKGIEKYPKSAGTLIVELVNYYLSSKKYQEAIDYLDLAIKTIPEISAILYTTKGGIYDFNLLKPDTAVLFYKKALAADSNYFDANYNLGVLYYNKAVEIEQASEKETNDLKFEALMVQRDEKFKEALPFLEKAYRINSDDLPTVEALRNIYYRLKMDAKMEDMTKKMQELKK